MRYIFRYLGTRFLLGVALLAGEQLTTEIGKLTPKSPTDPPSIDMSLESLPLARLGMALRLAFVRQEYLISAFLHDALSALQNAPISSTVLK
jgi:hypothetical protein